MLKIILKVTTIIIAITFVIFSTLKIVNQAQYINRAKNLYNANKNIPLQVLLETNFIEEIYGTVNNIQFTKDTISFDLINQDKTIEPDTILINKDDNFEFILRVEPDQYLNMQETIDQRLSSATSQIVDKETFINEIDNLDNIVITFKYNGLDNTNYSIEQIIYEQN